MPIVSRPIRPRRPSTFENFLRLLGTGTQVVGTIKGIQQRGQTLALQKEQGARSERFLTLQEGQFAAATELREKTRLKERGDVLVNEHWVEQVRQHAELLRSDSPRRNAEALEAIQSLTWLEQVFPGGVRNPQAPQTIMLADGVIQRGKLQDAATSAENISAAYTIGQERGRPMVKRFWQEYYAPILGVPPDQVPDSTVISAAPGSHRQSSGEVR